MKKRNIFIAYLPDSVFFEGFVNKSIPTILQNRFITVLHVFGPPVCSNDVLRKQAIEMCLSIGCH